MYRLEDLEVYQCAQTFGEKIWTIVEEWDSFAKWRVGSQLTEAADSIAANIAEGYGRYFFRQQILFCFYARGSLMECKSWILKCKCRSLITIAQYEELASEMAVIHHKLNAYIKNLKRNSGRQK